jgi:predicted RNase H-like nuclease (RuvC/YqgF family)
MNIKRWFAWFCLALMVVSEIVLFAALRQKDAAQTEAREAQVQMRQMQKDLDELKNSNAGLQAAEISRLRKQNEFYTNRLAEAHATIDQLKTETAKTADNLATARTALELQQQHLAELQTRNKIVTDAGLAIMHRNTCINGLRQIDGAKQQWALEHNKSGDAVPKPEELLHYYKDGIAPACPDGGTYYLNTVDEVPTCTIEGHALPQ